jgi:hypothetical protein
MGYMVDLFGQGRILFLVLLLGHFLLVIYEDGTIPCPMICISLMIHATHRSVLASTPASPLARVAASRVVIIFF